MNKVKKTSIGIAFLLLATLIGGFTFSACVEPAPGASPSSWIPTRDNVFDIGRSNKQVQDIYMYRYIVTNNGTGNLTLPTGNLTLATTEGVETLKYKTVANVTNSGTVVFPTGNVTLATLDGTEVFENKTMATPVLSTATINGTPVRSNVAMGIAEIQTDSAVTPLDVAHGLASTVTMVLLTYADDPGNNTAMPYFQTHNATHFYIYTTANASNTANLTWQAFIAAE